MRKAELDESPVGIKIAGRNINNLSRYADDTTLMAESEEELKSLLMRVKEESAKVGLKLNIKKTKIMASGTLTSWQIDGEEMEVVTDFIFLGSKITADRDCSQEIKRCLLLGRKAMANLDSILKSRDITMPTKVRIVKAMVFPVAMDPEIWRAVFGLHHLYSHKTYAIRRRVTKIMVHSRYDRESQENDIALFKLSKSVMFNEYVQPICIPDKYLILAKGTKCYIAGWGMQSENGTPSYLLQEAEIEIFPLEICNKMDWYAGTISQNNLCAGSETGHVDSCQGDSGGPLMCGFQNKKYYLIGITSYGYGCGRPKYPGIYVNVSMYRSWVVSRVSKNPTANIQCVLSLLTVAWVTISLVL
ncbi:Transmembrane protease serine 12 [Varanus komodoensis]|nr:Transmembrane protease serine 12 [Varanus komodoensis]